MADLHGRSRPGFDHGGPRGVCWRRSVSGTLSLVGARTSVRRSTQRLEGSGMTLVCFVLFSWFMVKAKTRRQVIALALAGTTVAVLVAPPRAEAQGSLVGAIQAVLNVINGVIHTALNSINSVRTAINNLYQGVAWPTQLINQARAQVTQIVGQYRNLMQGVFTVNLSSATLPVTQKLEQVIRNPQTSDFGTLTTDYGGAYGPVPSATAASGPDRAMTDMDDALALDNLKTLKETDDAGGLALQAADQLEDASGQAAPGSAPFLTATAVVASIESQALTQKMLAAELRQEAARLAHENALRKHAATSTSQLGSQIINLLKRK
jgi:hypothetical protein